MRRRLGWTETLPRPVSELKSVQAVFIEFRSEIGVMRNKFLYSVKLVALLPVQVCFVKYGAIKWDNRRPSHMQIDIVPWESNPQPLRC